MKWLLAIPFITEILFDQLFINDGLKLSNKDLAALQSEENRSTHAVWVFGIDSKMLIIGNNKKCNWDCLLNLFKHCLANWQSIYLLFANRWWKLIIFSHTMKIQTLFCLVLFCLHGFHCCATNSGSFWNDRIANLKCYWWIPMNQRENRNVNRSTFNHKMLHCFCFVFSSNYNENWNEK